MARNLAAYTEQYHRLPFEPIQAHFRRQRVLTEVARYAPRRLLEVGCGHLPLHTDLPGMHITVVEPAAEFAMNARSTIASGADVIVIEACLETVNPPEEPFDMVVVSCLLHEVDDPQALLAAVSRMCGMDTVVHLNVPNSRSLHRLLATAMGLIDRPEAHSDTQSTMQQRGIYDLESLEAELYSAGFVVRERGSLFVKPFTHGQMQQLVDQKFMTQTMLNGLSRLAQTLPELGSEIWINANLRHV
jgi:2-polyprenyl-3-methyl-5-hydroxy-6-metoxy-1,4-benzoquinol methylase